jgi:hypothetical protein
MSAEDEQIVRDFIDHTPYRGPTSKAIETHEAVTRLVASLQEAEWRGSLFHNLDLEARAFAAEAREAALREAAVRMLKAHLEPEHGEKRDAWYALNVALAADPESEEAPE